MDSRIVVADRIANASAVVALESSVLAQGLPSPANLESADAQQAAVAKAEAEPAVIGVIAGRVIVGADPHEVQALASGAVKVTVRDLPVVAAAWTGPPPCRRPRSRRAGDRDRGHGHRRDRRHPLRRGRRLGRPPQLARSRLTVVCSGPKHVADAAATIEWLETHGVQLVGYHRPAPQGSWPPAGSRWSRWPTTWTRWWS